jgi:hypothetical protein
LGEVTIEDGGHSQHRGLGRRMLEEAERIASGRGIRYMTVISGVGVKEYYRKHGYSNYHTYLRKLLPVTMSPIEIPNIPIDISHDVWLAMFLFGCIAYLICRLMQVMAY